MVERLCLTPEFVDAALPPNRGERWIGDTEVVGFGLRLWATQRGEGKAFAIRILTAEGKTVRKRFDPRTSSEYQLALFFKNLPPPNLGSYLTSARRWAWQEITHLKGRISYFEQLQNRRRRAAERKLRRTVQEIGEELLQRMRRRKLSEAYIDRLDKLFSRDLPETIRGAPLAEVEAAQIAAALSIPGLPPSAVGVLRPFIGRIFREAADAKPSLSYFSKHVGDHLNERRGRYDDRKFPALESLTEQDYKELFHRLERESIYWQQAMCVRLYFELWVPLSRLMAARWENIIDGRWYPYPLSERRLNLRYRSVIRGDLLVLVDHVRLLGEEKFGANPYWFPSEYGRKFGHIRTIDTIWRNTLHDLRAPYFPLRELARSYRHSAYHQRLLWTRLGLIRPSETSEVNS